MRTVQHKPRIKVWLLRGKKLTNAIAIRNWKCYRLSEYIRRLRNDGLRIKTTMIHNANGTCYAVYTAMS